MELLQCYNKGCGQQYNPDQNKDDSCRFHPGEPVFHDAYKGWSCCQKKCTDFTEFLNIKGCTLAKHSNVKPVEVKPPKVVEEVIEIIKPIVRTNLKRPAYETPLVKMEVEIMPSMKALMGKTNEIKSEEISNENGEVPIGTNCKNGGCTASYKGVESDSEICVFHPGCPIFHEGLKYWSCCTKRTTDFNAFLNQVGCKNGTHLWIKKDSNPEEVNCRWDHHQTSSHVVVTIYAKEYCPSETEINLNPIRLLAKVIFPRASFNMDIELQGIIDVNKSNVSYFGTKIEIKLKKAEPGCWSRLAIPRINEAKKDNCQEKVQEISLESQVQGVDLSDL